MQRFRGAALAAAVSVVLAGLGACSGKETAGPVAASPPPMPEAPTRDQVLAATVTGPLAQPAKLEAGRYQGPPADPGAASRPTLILLEPTILYGDVDGVAPKEAVALVTASEGGSGQFTHVALFSLREGQAQSVASAPVGDRVQVFRVWLERDKIHMDVLEAGPGDPACCPTQLSRKAYGWQDGKLVQTENSVVGGLSINLLAATDWMLVEMDGEPLAAGSMPPTALVQYGKIAGFAGCSRYEAPLEESKPGAVRVGAIAVTPKACDEAASAIEARFLAQLGKVDGYSFDAGRLVLAGPPDPQGVRGRLVFSR